MTTYAVYERKVANDIPTEMKSREMTPRIMTDGERKLVQQIYTIDEQFKTLAAEKAKLLEMLPYQTPIVGLLGTESEGEEEWRTIIVDRPQGGYVHYKPLDITMDAKTTKKDAILLGLPRD